MERTISSWLVPLLLAVGCVALVGNIFHTRSVNKSLVVDIEQATADLQVASDSGKDCTKKLLEKTAEVTAKDQQVATLTANVATLTEQVTQLTAQLATTEKPEEAPKEEKPAEAA
eukprot:GFUD01052871.1.p1 GENE.GFUD01052871.1~~GFUD01052871.1.p1  ORF type:complete len:115 (+),score=46.37 GFUD01052871.1:54-398(+)